MASTTSTTRRILPLTALLSLLVLAGTAALEYWYESGKTFDQLPWPKWPLILLNLGREQTLGSWLTGALLAAGGVAFLLAAALRRGRAAALPLVGGLALLGFSLDEVAAFHERIFASNPADASSAFDSPVPWLLPVLPVALLLRQLLRSRQPGRSRIPLVTWAGVAALCAVPLQQEIENRQYAPGQRPPALLLLEEGTELLGAWLLLAAALLLVRAASGGNPRALTACYEQLRRRWWLLFNVAGVLSVLATQAGYAAYGDYAGDPQSGLPQWWFGSVAAAVLAGTAFRARHSAPRTIAHPVGAVTVIAWTAVLLCVAFGIDAFSWLTVADGSLDRAGRIAVALALGIGGLWLALTWRLAGLAVAAAAVIVALGQAAAGPWEVGACWFAAALVFEATLPPGTARGLAPGAVYPRSSAAPGRLPVSAAPRTGPAPSRSGGKPKNRSKPKRRR